MSTINLKDMLIDKFVLDTDNEKAELRQVDLKVGNNIRTCFIVSKKRNTVQIKSIVADNTVEELEIKFVQNSLKMTGVKASTWIYKGGMDIQLVSEKDLGVIDLNKYSVTVGNLYVPVNVVLTPYFKEKATNVVYAGAIKSLNLVDDNRIKALDDKSKDIKLHTILDLSIIDSDGKVVDVDKLSNKKLKSLSGINNNDMYMRIIAGEYNVVETVKGGSNKHNAVNTFDEIGFINECVTKMKSYKSKENKSDIETLAFLMSKMSKEDSELLINNNIFRQAVMLEAKESNTTDVDPTLFVDPTLLGSALFEIQALRTLNEEEKMELVLDLAISTKKDKIKDIDTFKAQVRLLLESDNKEEKNEQEEIIGGESRMENVVTEINNDSIILNTVEKRIISIRDKYLPLLSDKGQINDIMNIALTLGEEGFNKIENEQVFRTMMGLPSNKETVNTKEAATIIGQALISATELSNMDMTNISDDEAVAKCLSLFKITDSIDSIVNKEEFLKNVITIVDNVLNKEEVEKVEAEIVVEDESKQHNVVGNKSENKEVNNIVVVDNRPKQMTNNKVYVGMVKYISDTLGDTGLVKYTKLLSMIHDKLGKEAIANIAKSNKTVNSILNMYSRSEIELNIVKGYDVVSELIKVLGSSVYGYEEMNIIMGLPVDIKVKLVYLLLEKEDVTIETLSIEDRALFYIVLNRSLNVTVDDMRQTNSSGEFTLTRARVSVRNRETVKKYIA